MSYVLLEQNQKTDQVGKSILLISMEQAGDQSVGEKGMGNKDGDGVGADPEGEIV